MNKALYILLFLLPFYCAAQLKNFGTPEIVNFPRSVYKGGTQNWGIAQDQNGFLYFANNDGLLKFDGINWELIRISDTSPLRSVFVDSRNNIFIGLINDFGVIASRESGKSEYKSLKHLLPEGIGDFNEIWRIHEIPRGIVFQCFDCLFIYRDEEVEVMQPQNQFHFSFRLDNRLYVHERGLGIFELIDGKLEKLSFGIENKGLEISAIFEMPDDNLLICSLQNGIFITEEGRLNKWDTPVNELLKESKLYSAASLPGNYYAFGTILNGLIITDAEGNVIQKLSRRNGIQNNTVLSILVGNDNNLWLGLDNGIDYLEVNSPVSFIGANGGFGTGYCCRIFKGNIYLGTNQGLYVSQFSGNNSTMEFRLVNNTAGQVWSLDIFDGQLVCGHNSGTFLINGVNSVKISNEPGAWKYIQLKGNSDYLLGGHYAGLILLKKGIRGWEFQKKIEGFNESCRFIKQDEDENIWISHGTKGVYKVILDDSIDSVKNYELFTAENGLPSNANNILFEFQNGIFVSTIEKVYRYNDSMNLFEPATEFNDLLNINGRIKALQEDEMGNVWYISQNETGVLRSNEDLSYTKITLPFKELNNRYVNEFENIYPFSEKSVFIGIDNGFAHYSSEFPKLYSREFNCYITGIDLPYIDSMIFLHNDIFLNEFEFPFRKNNFRFHFTAPFFENTLPLEFSYFLENYSEKWAEWNNDNYKDYTNLREGEYKFKVKAKNVYGVESKEAEFRFIITPPWHRSKTAYFLYFILLIISVYGLVRFVLYRMDIARRREKIKHEEELLRQQEQYKHQSVIAEKEIIKLRNDKLRAEKLHRDKELANQTMNLIQKNRFLNKLNDELQRLQNITEDSTVITKLVLIKKRIKKELDDKQQNLLFETYFEDVHSEFFKRLKEKYPHLSPNDLKLSAYIRMNIPTKEIATLLNISYRGAEISRYRLRKKLEISREVNLTTFLSNI